ncbi:MAG: cysteine desulfurase [Bacteriovorax sp.]|jgi:cysteine desulfurase|nr:cysteine desulfurase [Bacteriovorax sp.]
MIYADYNGSAPLSTEVQQYLIKRFEKGPFANPNAIHYLGTRTMMAMENARAVCAKVLGADFDQVIFNSGATEGISTVFHTVLSNELKKKTIIISGIEHSAVVNTAQYYQGRGFHLKILPTTSEGLIDLSILKKWIEEEASDIAMVAIMAANNETGIIQPYQEINALCLNKNIPYLCDTTQFIGKTPFHFKEANIDYAVCSGHKLGAMTGTGILLAKNPEKLLPLIIGGGQEKGHRGGTQNYIGNETLAVALSSLEKTFENISSLSAKRMEFEKKVKAAFPEVVIIGENSPRLATTTYISYPGIHGQAVQIELESQDIFVTTSSACSDNMPMTSKVLMAMGTSDDIGRGVVRISLCLNSPLDYYDRLADGLMKAYAKLSKVKSF